jgi:hypothetical protein
MEPEVPLPFSHVPATGPYPEPDTSSPPTPPHPRSSECSPPFKLSDQNFVCISHLRRA